MLKNIFVFYIHVSADNIDMIVSEENGLFEELNVISALSYFRSRSGNISY